MTSLSQLTKGLLAMHNLRPKKRLGQNFLIDDGVLQRIVSAGEILPGEKVLEIGTGLGVLTKELASRCREVVTVDTDKDMLMIAEDVLKGFTNIKYVNESFLEWLEDEEFSSTKKDIYFDKVVANVPYYITSPIIEKLFSFDKKPKKIVLLVQKEVAERIVAKEGTVDYSSFSIFVQNRGEPSIASFVSRRSFLPPPNVDSAILVIKPFDQPKYKIREELVRASFGKRRKMLRSALKDFALDFEKAGIDPCRRGETLSLEEFERLSA